jgi:multidrug efflux system membrane fusion protein
MKRSALLLLGIVACGPSGGDAPTRTAVPVTLGEVRRDSISVVVQADGRLVSRPNGSALLVAPADAVVKRVATQIGARVKSGTLIIELDAPDLTAQAAGLRAQATAAAADADRQRQLFAEGIAARRDMEERVAAAEALQAQADAAEALHRRATVRSPLDGLVAQLLVRAGSRVSAGDQLAEIIDPSQVYAVASIPANQLQGIRAGQPARLHLEGATSDPAAVVQSVGATIDSLSNTAQVLVQPRRYDPMLRPGLGVTIAIQVATHRNALVVPSGAIVLVGNSPTIFVVGSDSIAHARSVVPGARSGDRVEVTGEVNAGDRIVVVGAYGLPDSAHVVPRAASGP